MTYDVKAIKEVLQTSSGQELVRFLTAKAASLSSIEAVKEIDDPVGQAVELKAQKRASELVHNILSEVIDIADAQPTIRGNKSEFASGLEAPARP